MPARGRKGSLVSSGFGLSINEPLESGDAGPRMNRRYSGRWNEIGTFSIHVLAIQHRNNCIYR
jgi:hypothetical protein